MRKVIGFFTIILTALTTTIVRANAQDTVKTSTKVHSSHSSSTHVKRPVRPHKSYNASKSASVHATSDSSADSKNKATIKTSKTKVSSTN